MFFLALRGSRPVGRIAAIVNRRYVDKLGKNCGRFGWFECEDNRETANALLDAAEDWLSLNGMTEISGPMGFTDNDMTGFLIEGFDELPTISGSYNPEWYNDLMTSRGYVKEVDYVEFKITVPDALPEKVERLTALFRSRMVSSHESLLSRSPSWIATSSFVPSASVPIMTRRHGLSGVRRTLK